MRKNRTKEEEQEDAREADFLNQIKSFFGFSDKKETPVAGQPVHPATSTEPVTSELPPSTTPPSAASVEPLTSSSQAGGRRRKHKRKSKKHKRKTRRTRKKRRSRRKISAFFLVHNFK